MGSALLFAGLVTAAVMGIVYVYLIFSHMQQALPAP